MCKNRAREHENNRVWKLTVLACISVIESHALQFMANVSCVKNFILY